MQSTCISLYMNFMFKVNTHLSIALFDIACGNHLWSVLQCSEGWAWSVLQRVGVVNIPVLQMVGVVSSLVGGGCMVNALKDGCGQCSSTPKG